MTKQFKITMVLLLLAVAAFMVGNYYFQRWVDFKMLKVGQGLAEDQFPWRDFTQDELNKMFPQIKYADVATRVTPEQTYAKFRQALKDNNLQMAIEQLSGEGEKHKENKTDLEKAYNKGQFKDIYIKYTEKIIQDNMYESISQYYFNYTINGESQTHVIGFTKDANGDWKMDNL